MNTGAPANVRSPLLPIENTVTVPSAGLAVNRRSPFGETAIACGWKTGGGAGAGGEGGGKVPIVPRLPLPGSTVKAVMSPDVWLATYRNGAVGDMAMEIGPVPVLKILGGFTGTTTLLLTGTERLPLLLLMSSKVTSLPENAAI